MKKVVFDDVMNRCGVGYIHYTSTAPNGSRKTTFVVGTTDFDDKYIQKVEAHNKKTYGSPRPEVNDGEVLIFSYSKNKFRKLKLATIVRVTPLNTELNRASKF